MPAIFYFISKSAFLGLISNAVMFPLKVYPGVRCLPFPKFGLSGGIFYLPILIFFIMIYSLITQANNIDLQKKWLIFFCLFMEIGFFNYTRIRSDIRHLLPTMILTIIFFGFLVFMAIEKKSSRYRRNAYGIIALFSMILLIISVFPKAKLLFLHLNQPGLSLELKRAHGCYDQEKITQDQQEAVEYIQQRTKPDERIFVGNLRHDRIVMNDIMFYFLSERHSVTMYHELHPGLATTEDIQKKIVNEIKQSNIRYVVCWMDDEKIVEENQSCKSSEVMILDDFIRNRYKTEKVLDHYKILRRIEP
jgi:hypothetical protein